jgi:co-chaperonin GroES (HSP10)
MTVRETTRDSGIILSQTDSVDTYKAEVIVIGPMVKFIKAGEIVLLTVGAIQGAIFEHNQQHYAMVFEGDVLAVLDRS